MTTISTVSIITPVWNRADLTYNFLNQNLHYLGDYEGAEWIIVNNGSNDGTPGVLKAFENKANVKIINNDTNIGFGAANNRAAKLSKADVFIFINNDVITSGDYITPIMDTLQRVPNAITGAELLNYDTGWNVFDGKIISYIHGWCMAMRADVFYDLGGFDERYTPGDYEDIDICYAATQKDYVLMALNLPLEHMSGQTGRQLPNRREITNKHRGLFAEKWSLKNEPG